MSAALMPTLRPMEDRMTLRLVSCNNDPALAVCDHLTELIRKRGAFEVQRDSVQRW